MIIANLRYLAEVSRTRERPAQPTFRGTVDTVSRLNKLPKSAVADTLRKLIDEGVISQEQQTVGDNPDVKVIVVDWDKAGVEPPKAEAPLPETDPVPEPETTSEPETAPEPETPTETQEIPAETEAVPETPADAEQNKD